MEVRPGYKLTEVGVIPEEWEVKQLGDIAQLKNGFSFRSSTYTPLGQFKVVTIASVQDGYMNATECNKVAALPRELQAHHRLRRGDVLISMTGNVGRVCRVTEDDCLLNQRVGKLVSSGVEENLLFILLGQRAFLAAMSGKAKGGAQGNISKSDITEYRFPVPPAFPEQRAIATALSDVDELLDGLERLIVKKRDLKQAAMQQLLTGETRLPGFHGEWEVKRLGHVGRCLRGVSYQGESDLSTRDTDHTNRLLRSNNVQDAVLVTSEVQFVNSARVSPNQVLKKNDILICMANGSKALVGKAGLFAVNDGHDYTFGAFMGCFRPDAATSNPAFVFFLFQTGRYRDYINTLLAGSSINNLKPSSVESIEFLFPPLPEQCAIAAVLTDMDAEVAALMQQLVKTRALKQGMMQELLTGRTRLVAAEVAS
jgi:type I restriction enzyme S subunit